VRHAKSGRRSNGDFAAAPDDRSEAYSEKWFVFTTQQASSRGEAAANPYDCVEL
jgi:hypothetical protein